VNRLPAQSLTRARTHSIAATRTRHTRNSTSLPRCSGPARRLLLPVSTWPP